MKNNFIKYQSFILLSAGIIAIFLIRSVLALRFPVPRLNDIFTILTLSGSLVVVLAGFRQLQRNHWFWAVLIGTVIGTGMCFASLFTPYPFLEIAKNNTEHAVVRGPFTCLSVIGGLVIQQRGGSVHLYAASGSWRKTFRGVLLGLTVGAPLALINVLALKITQGHPIVWQNPFSALLDALQPAIVEEVVYRLAMWGLLWVVLNKSIPEKSVWLSGLLSMLVHNYQHFDDLFLQSPIMAIGMGLVMAIFWGIPPMVLARRRGLESAIAFHWLQDAARFVTGF